MRLKVMVKTTANWTTVAIILTIRNTLPKVCDKDNTIVCSMLKSTYPAESA